jgi:hypothetical protein
MDFNIFSVFTFLKIIDITFRKLFRECGVFCDIRLEQNVASGLYILVTALVSGSLEGTGLNLGRRYIIVRFAVCLPTSGNKLEFFSRCGSSELGVKFEELTRRHTPLSSQDKL